MRLLVIILISLCLAPFNMKAQFQIWHSSNDTLKSPKSLGYVEVAVAFINHYDTIFCLLKEANSKDIFLGYKLMYVKNGFFIDDAMTLKIFFDERKRRIYNVSEYSFN